MRESEVVQSRSNLKNFNRPRDDVSDDVVSIESFERSIISLFSFSERARGVSFSFFSPFGMLCKSIYFAMRMKGRLDERKCHLIE